jgi:hypothetical protein
MENEMNDRIGSPVRPIIEWPTYPLALTRVRRSSVKWSPDRHLVPGFQTWLRALDLSDPTSTEHEPQAAASAYWKRARAVFDEARHVRPDEPPRKVSDLIAEGEVSLADGKKMLLAQARKAREAQDSLREQQKQLDKTASATLLRALQAICDYSEEGWLGLLRPIVADAVAKQDDRRFNLAHAFAAWLRDPEPSFRVFGLSAATNNGRDAERGWYQVARPDLLYRWRVERANDTQRHQLTHYAQGGLWFSAYALLPGAPVPTLRDYEPSWRPGLYSAAEVLANIENSKREQEREFARLAQRAPAAPPTGRRRVVAIL